MVLQTPQLTAVTPAETGFPHIGHQRLVTRRQLTGTNGFSRLWLTVVCTAWAEWSSPLPVLRWLMSGGHANTHWQTTHITGMVNHTVD